MKPWEDDIIKGADWIKKYLDVVVRERAQLYGMIINLMLKHNETEIELPPFSTFTGYAEKYYILFDEVEDNKFYMFLKERVEEVESK